MKQGVLPFSYEEEKRSTGMTALVGLPAYLELARVASLSRSIPHATTNASSKSPSPSTALCFIPSRMTLPLGAV